MQLHRWNPLQVMDTFLSICKRFMSPSTIRHVTRSSTGAPDATLAPCVLIPIEESQKQQQSFDYMVMRLSAHLPSLLSNCPLELQMQLWQNGRLKSLNF
jgi:hypothetical protein